MWPNKDGDEEPDWVKTERQQFTDIRDVNKDGKMDNEEVKSWIIPADYDHSEAEARHLVFEADTDKVDDQPCPLVAENRIALITGSVLTALNKSVYLSL